MIGSGIFISPKGVLQQTESVGMALVVWSLGGVVAMFGKISKPHNSVVYFCISFGGG